MSSSFGAMRTPPVSPDPASLAPGDGLGTPQQPLSRTSTIRTTNSAKMTVRTGTLTTLPEMTEQPDREVLFPSTTFKRNANYIKTTKYTLLTFLPFNLAGQFKRFYNIYFLLGALSTIGGNSAISAWTAIFPLVFILAVTALKDAWEDIRRYRADEKANNEIASVLKNGVEQKMPSKNIQVGDVLLVRKGEKFAADLVLLDSSFQDGVCYVETADLDGETNLKRRSALAATKGFGTPQNPGAGKIQATAPNKDLHEFDARLHLTKPDGTEKTYALSINQFLPRGAVLRNTEYVFAVVVYTGLDTKVMKNNTKGKLKFSTLEGRLNALVTGIFIYNLILLALAVAFSGLVRADIYETGTDFWYLQDPKNPNDEYSPNKTNVNYGYLAWMDILTWFATLSYIIPLSLFVSIELARIVQTWLIQGDKKMVGYRKPDYNPHTTALGKEGFTQLTIRRGSQSFRKPEEATGQAAFVPVPLGKKGGPRTGYEKEVEYRDVPSNWTKIGASVTNSNLNEDLGVLDFLFSDKTGTLTRNEMTLNRMWVPGIKFDEVKDSGRLGKILARGKKGQRNYDAAHPFAMALAVCHDVLPSLNDDPSQGLVYESPSPDDIAICNGLRRNGIDITGRTKTLLQTAWFGEEQDYELLRLLEFSSDRKRMSAIVRLDGTIYLCTKGADNIMFDRLAEDHNPTTLAEAKNAVSEFAREGLRTLVVGYRTLSEDDWLDFSDRLDEAEKQMRDREGKMAAVMETLEHSLQVLGVTGIDDRLQDEVPETIAYLLACDIKVWVLTGDKQETAINIGLSSRVISEDSRLFIYDMKDSDALGSKLDETIAEFKAADAWGRDNVRPEDMLDKSITAQLSLGQRMRYAWRRFARYMRWLMPVNRNPRAGWGNAPEIEDKWRRNAMVITGDALNVLFEPWGAAQKGAVTDLQRSFLEVATRCKSVICCRVAPLQKAQIVRLVGDGLHKVTLAIGDGANDVPMIQAANIGVGISGREGGQAVRASDYSFLEFKNLRTLISVHGRWNFLRMSELIYYSFYKNIAMITVFWIYGFWTLWSGTNVYEETFLVYFNVAFSAVPPFVVACFEKDVARTPLYRYPELYRESRVHYWNLQTFTGWIIAAVCVSVVVFFVGFGIWGDGVLMWNGRSLGYDSVIYIWSSLIMTAVLLRLAIMVKGWTHLHWAALALSYVLWLVLQLYSTSRDFLAVNFTELHAVPVFWLMLLLIPIASVVLDSGIVGRNALFATPDYRIINEEWAVECDRNKYVDPETGEVVNAVPQQSEVWDSMADLGSQEIALPPSASAMDAPLNESDASAGGGNGLPLSADGAAVWIELAQPPVSPRSLAREIHWPIGDKSPS